MTEEWIATPDYRLAMTEENKHRFFACGSE
jgi:hypothetical protein